MKNWLTEKISKFLAKKAGLYEGTPQNGKPWYKSKTIISNIVVMLIGVYYGVSEILVLCGKPALPEIPNSVLVFLGGLGVYGRLDASKPISIK